MLKCVLHKCTVHAFNYHFNRLTDKQNIKTVLQQLCHISTSLSPNSRKLLKSAQQSQLDIIKIIITKHSKFYISDLFSVAELNKVTDMFLKVVYNLDVWMAASRANNLYLCLSKCYGLKNLSKLFSHQFFPMRVFFRMLT